MSAPMPVVVSAANTTGAPVAQSAAAKTASPRMSARRPAGVLGPLGANWPLGLVDPHGPLDNQHQQTEAVLEHAEAYDGPTAILGDFNTLSRRKAIEIRKLMESHDFTTPFPTNIATWRGAGLRFHADWIFGRGVRVNRWGVAKPLNVSDHWPIWAEVETEG